MDQETTLMWKRKKPLNTQKQTFNEPRIHFALHITKKTTSKTTFCETTTELS